MGPKRRNSRAHEEPCAELAGVEHLRVSSTSGGAKDREVKPSDKAPERPNNHPPSPAGDWRRRELEGFEPRGLSQGSRSEDADSMGPSPRGPRRGRPIRGSGSGKANHRGTDPRGPEQRGAEPRGAEPRRAERRGPMRSGEVERFQFDDGDPRVSEPKRPEPRRPSRGNPSRERPSRRGQSKGAEPRMSIQGYLNRHTHKQTNESKQTKNERVREKSEQSKC
jgi:hypothetical protein